MALPRRPGSPPISRPWSSTREPQPAITAAQEDVVAEAELAVRVRLIVARNRCADECGSAVFTNLAKVTWTVRPTASAAGQGEVEGVTFTVTPSARGWAVKLNAC